MALLTVESAEQQYFSSGGGTTSYWDKLVQSSLNPWSEPVAPAPPTTLVNNQSVDAAQVGCVNCAVPAQPAAAPTPTATLPPPNIVPNSPLSAVSQTGGKPTYSALAGDTETEVTTGPGMQSDWWKYLIGAAIGYAIARMR